MEKAFIYLPALEGDSWVRADLIVGLYRRNGGTQTEVHFDTDGEISITLTDLTPVRVLHKLQEVWESTNV